MSARTDETTNRAMGALIGLAVGDALGTTLEFTRRDSKPPLTDMVGGGPFRLKPGEWTDDTSMALCLADSLLTCNKLDPVDLMTRFVAWYRTGKYSSNGRCFDIGTTTKQAIERFETTRDPIAGSRSDKTAGNGSAMRLAPVATFWCHDPKAALAAARRQSETTHGATEAVEGCALLCSVLLAAIAGVPKPDALATAPPITSPKLQTLARGAWRDKPRDQIKSSGYIVDSLEAALWAVASTDDFASAVLLAANLGDDADTVGAITGQIAGALYGAAAIPGVWRTRLAFADRIERVASALAAGPKRGWLG